MAKNPNRTPNKGFIRELATKPEAPKAKQNFTWTKHVATDGKAEDYGTLRRMQRHARAKEGTSNIVEEHKTHVENRRKK